MSYVESNLLAGEHVVHRGKIHWAIFVPGVILAPVLIGLLLLLLALFTVLTTEMAVTNRRVIAKSGLISRRTLEMNLNKVENIGITQGILGRILGYGAITVVGTGGTRETFKAVANPVAFRQAVQSHSQAAYREH